MRHTPHLTRYEAEKYELATIHSTVHSPEPLILTVPEFTPRVRSGIQRNLNSGILDGLKGKTPFWSAVIMTAYGIPFLQHSKRSKWDRSYTLRNNDTVIPDFDTPMMLLGFKVQKMWGNQWNWVLNDNATREVSNTNRLPFNNRPLKKRAERDVDQIAHMFQQHYLKPMGWEIGLEIPKQIEIRL